MNNQKEIGDLKVTPGLLDKWLSGEGFDFYGLTEARDFPEYTELYRLWLNQKQQGAMDFLERHLPFKYNPSLLLSECRSVLLVGLNYYQSPLITVPEGYGRVALYAWGRDYHKILLRKLKHLVTRLQQIFPDEHFKAGVDSTPLSESCYAEQAGLGWRGKNTLIINGNYGSWFVIGEILTTVAVGKLQALFSPEPMMQSVPNRDTPKTSQRCGTAKGCPPGCNLCQKACPTKALYAPYRINASRCVSYLTIEYKKEIDPAIWPELGDWLFGCDICQGVCPVNRQGLPTREPDFMKHRSSGILNLERLLSIKNANEYQGLFAGSPLMRAGKSRLLRNAIIVAANTRNRELKPLISRLSKDEDPLIAWHAQQAEYFLSS